jgi:hypothetical protein
MARIEENAVVVTLVSNDEDLADLLRYLSKYDEFEQQHLVWLAGVWLKLNEATGVDSSRMDLGPSQADLPHPAQCSEHPKES